jgi:hypothetical protein
MRTRKPSCFLVISAASVGSWWLKRCFLPLFRAGSITSIKVTPDDLVKYTVLKSQPLSCLKKDEFAWEVVQYGFSRLSMLLRIGFFFLQAAPELSSLQSLAKVFNSRRGEKGEIKGGFLSESYKG